jgi:hypothetical protein
MIWRIEFKMINDWNILIDLEFIYNIIFGKISNIYYYLHFLNVHFFKKIILFITF